MPRLLFLFILLFGLFGNLLAKPGYPSGLVLESHDEYSSVNRAFPEFMKHRGLPSSVDLSADMPPVGYQGIQSSCVAWSTAYATKSYNEYVERKNSGNWKLADSNGDANPGTVFSPAFIYNQINKGRDAGSTIYDAVQLVVNQGAAPLADMPYSENNYTRQPSRSAREKAMRFRAKSFLRLDTNELDEVKSQLHQGRPVIAGIMIHENFYDLQGREIYSKGSGGSMGGHAVTLVGYDDSRRAFKFLNSWSDQWGDHGYGYIDYNWFKQTCKRAYVLIDQTENTTKPETTVPKKDNIDPIPPENIAASHGNFSDRVEISWDAVPNAIGYEIHRSLNDSFEKIGLSTSTSFADTGVQGDISYYYKIATVYENKVSDPSPGKVMGYAKSAASNKPPRVTGVKASEGASINSISLEWENADKASGYNIHKLVSGQMKIIARTKSNSFTDRRAKRDGIMETYRVSAYNRHGSGDLSDAVYGYTLKRNDPPARPQNLVASQGQFKNRVELSWEASEGANIYVVYKYSWSDKKWLVAGKSRNNNFTDTKPLSAKTYYTVIAGNRQGKWSPFSKYSLGFPDTNAQRAAQRPAAPSGFSLSMRGKNASLAWKPVAGVGLYNIWRKKQGERKWEFLASTKNTRFATTLPEKETFYLFTVTAKSELGGDSAFSTGQSAVFSTAAKAGKQRTFESTSMAQKLEGKWSGMQWTGNDVKNVSLEITPDDANKTLTVRFNNRVIFNEGYIENSPVIEKDGKFRMQLSSEEDSLRLNLDDPALGKDEVVFLKN